MKKALITGIAGQDGSYLAELLLDKKYDVSGFITENSSISLLEPIKDKISLIKGDLLDERSIKNAINQSMPDEVYHLAARSFVAESWKEPILTGDVNSLGTTRLLESIRKIKPDIKVYHASTSEMFGQTSEIKSEKSPFHPKSPYAISKCFSHWISINYRESYNMFICCGILFNHESPRRDISFVTKKIAQSVVEIEKGKIDCFYLGNIDSKRDWGYAKEYVEVVWLMLQQNSPDDYIISTGELHWIREFLEETLYVAGIPVTSNGKPGIDEEYRRIDNNETVVKISEKFFRPVELDVLQGSNTKARKKLGWEPKVKFKRLVEIMVQYEKEQLK